MQTNSGLKLCLTSCDYDWYQCCRNGSRQSVSGFLWKCLGPYALFNMKLIIQYQPL